MSELRTVSDAPDQSDMAPLRAEIDRIDDAMHDLLMRRAAVVQQVGRIKSASGASGRLRPGREAAIIRRLLARHRGALPRQVVVRVWRELLAGALGLQTPVVVAVGRDPAGDFPAIAREHFGALAVLHVQDDPIGVLDTVRSGEASVAVLPLGGVGWWRCLRPAGEMPLHVVGRLPFWQPRAPGAPLGDALMVAATLCDASGHDRTVLLAKPGQSVAPGLCASILAVCDCDTLLEVDGLIDAQNPGCGTALVLGAYACPIGMTKNMELTR